MPGHAGPVTAGRKEGADISGLGATANINGFPAATFVAVGPNDTGTGMAYPRAE